MLSHESTVILRQEVECVGLATEELGVVAIAVEELLLRGAVDVQLAFDFQNCEGLNRLVRGSQFGGLFVQSPCGTLGH